MTTSSKNGPLRQSASAISKLEEENEAIKKENETIKKENKAIKKENEAIKKDNETIKKEKRSIKKEYKAIKKDICKTSNEENEALKLKYIIEAQYETEDESSEN